jgi:uncharacterized membrane protein YdcZ (DUF606 family)
MLYLSGLFGAGVAVVMARYVERLGVLRLMLTLIAGQTIGGLIIDLAAPPPDESVTTVTALSVLLALAAASITARDRTT